MRDLLAPRDPRSRRAAQLPPVDGGTGCAGGRELLLPKPTPKAPTKNVDADPRHAEGAAAVHVHVAWVSSGGTRQRELILWLSVVEGGDLHGRRRLCLRGL